MRKFISLRTLEIAKAQVEWAINDDKVEKETLRSLFTADTELGEAIEAAKKEPEPRVPKAKRGRPRKAEATPPETA